MKPTIMKFGGTSVEGATAFKNVARIVMDRQALRPVVVVSAIAGFTDALIQTVQQALPVGADAGANSLEKHFDRHLRVIEALLRSEADRMRQLISESRIEIRKLLNAAVAEAGDDGKRRKFFADAIVSYGERLSAELLAAVLQENHVASCAVDARRCVITDDDYGCAVPLMAETFASTRKELEPLIGASCVPVLGGFIGSTLTGETTTLGRGGSDTSAVAIAAAIQAERCDIYTDVDGIYTTDPRVAPEARKMDSNAAKNDNPNGVSSSQGKWRKPLTKREVSSGVTGRRAAQRASSTS